MDVPVLAPPQLAKRFGETRYGGGGAGSHNPADASHLVGLLRTRRERPCRRAAEKRDESAASHCHSISSSARSKNDSGIFRPRAFAVVRLMTRSNLVGCTTG